jgi:hypothetical protein
MLHVSREFAFHAIVELFGILRAHDRRMGHGRFPVTEFSAPITNALWCRIIRNPDRQLRNKNIAAAGGKGFDKKDAFAS